ncbi:hypothetical protein EBE87_25885 [Pseudoroseomonas wenyumeiae]|uniref:Uncharacterized protein n=1 Tax=Teichococcus wenyumeiae TaxID=2478470 RepID=A0A3A9JA55_9PROT|nr:hypothetical protein [Pseudoroseomonas wenyumeiae]RKK03322.1 hypothetical protein D6Z83_15295 [Pseudoroseomonas wenyumeiae]RMI15410.1 hypothetical protein EBE87_25885 [Pseudoroseomonas wenyumeiae]
MGALVKTKPETIPGLAAADAAAADAFNKVLALRAEIRDAASAVRASVSKRDQLLARAKKGEIIRADEVAEAENAIRTAEAGLALLQEALPAVERDWSAAERALAVAAWTPQRQLKEAAQARYEAADKALGEAKAERIRAYEHNEKMKLWDFETHAAHFLEEHAPAALTRAKALGKTRGF